MGWIISLYGKECFLARFWDYKMCKSILTEKNRNLRQSAGKRWVTKLVFIDYKINCMNYGA